MTILFNNFSERINEQSLGQNDHDKDEFLKPIINDKNEQIISESSKISKIYSDIKKQNHLELVCYTNEKRESPSNSFYEEKKDEILHIIGLGEEESVKITIPKYEEENEEEDMEEEIEEEDDQDDDPVSYKDTPLNSEFKKQLNPPSNDRMSDFDEKTHGRKIEIFKKNTEEMEKEENFNRDLSLNKNKTEDKSSIFVKLDSKIKSK